MAEFMVQKIVHDETMNFIRLFVFGKKSLEENGGHYLAAYPAKYLAGYPVGPMSLECPSKNFRARA